jgi:hypothetical protein
VNDCPEKRLVPDPALTPLKLQMIEVLSADESTIHITLSILEVLFSPDERASDVHNDANESQEDYTDSYSLRVIDPDE